MDSGSSTEGLATGSFFTFAGVGPFAGLGALGAFSFLALGGFDLLSSAGALGSGLGLLALIAESATSLVVFEALPRSGRAVPFSIFSYCRTWCLSEYVGAKDT